MKERNPSRYEVNKALINRIGKEQKRDVLDFFVLSAIGLAVKDKIFGPLLLIYALYKGHDFLQKESEKDFLKTFQPYAM